MKRVALFPGSFDPFTVGHESIVKRGLALFDTVVIAVGFNASKPGFFPLENRMNLIREIFKGDDRIVVSSYSNLTVDFCKEVNANFILRGLRTSADFEYERAIAQVNKSMAPGIQSVFLLTTPEHTPVNSTIVRDIIRHNGDASKFIPNNVDYKRFLP